jgi:hypothetical protein
MSGDPMSEVSTNVAPHLDVALLSSDEGHILPLTPPVSSTVEQIRLDAFINAVERLEHIIDVETELLQAHKLVALQQFNHKKIFGLLELRRAMQAQVGHAFDPEMENALSGLRGKLETNLCLLQMHLTAVREISSIIAQAIQDHESDGTYTGHMRSGRVVL